MVVAEGECEDNCKSRSPFDFAQGRLFGDDNQKGKDKSNHKEETLLVE
jgi:hypothetical protein